MYKLLLAWRYLRTRFIALASIVSVTLGVATLIVVNSVMAGFVTEMKDRLHGILSDIEFGAPGLGELEWPDLHLREIESAIGPDVEAMTCVVRVPALLNFQFRGRQFTQQIMLLGIDEESFGKVTDFLPYLLNEKKRQHLNFDLEEQGYAPKLGECGWEYRREKTLLLQQIEEMTRRSQQSRAESNPFPSRPEPNQVAESPSASRDEVQLTELPVAPPNLDELAAQSEFMPGSASSSTRQPPRSGFDPASQHRPQIALEDMFDASHDQHTGIILGLAISNRKLVDDADGSVSDVYLLRPGDDVQIALPTAGPRPMPIAENCTVVDFYSSNMHEYDSSFAFVPLKKLQQLRGMIDPQTGLGNISAIQIRLRPNSNLDAARDTLTKRFPSDSFPYVIQTWQDTQRPLLSAVDLEVTILNILLFLIIAVAGFGILATFFMIVVEKTKDIGVLKALGAPSSGVMSIFLAYGVSLGTVGTGVGILLGLLFVWRINQIADLIAWVTGREVFDPTIYYFSEIPTLVNLWTVAWVAIGAILIAVMASVLPALRAARLHPVEALRYE